MTHQLGLRHRLHSSVMVGIKKKLECQKIRSMEYVQSQAQWEIIPDPFNEEDLVCIFR